MNYAQTQLQDDYHLSSEMEADLHERGIQYTVERVSEDTGTLKQGTLVARITSIPAIEHAVIGVLAGVDEPPNEEARKIYDEYTAQVEKEQCKGCAKGRLLREYGHRLRVALQGTKLLEYYEKEEERKIKYERFLQEQEERRLKNEQLRQEQEEQARYRARVEESGSAKDEAHVPSGIVQVPGSGTESDQRAGKRPSLLRRAARRIAKIYRACTEP